MLPRGTSCLEKFVFACMKRCNPSKEWDGTAQKYIRTAVNPTLYDARTHVPAAFIGFKNIASKLCNNSEG